MNEELKALEEKCWRLYMTALIDDLRDGKLSAPERVSLMATLSRLHYSRGLLDANLGDRAELDASTHPNHSNPLRA